MGYQTIRYEVKGGVATITLNRPDAYNALNLARGATSRTYTTTTTATAS